MRVLDLKSDLFFTLPKRGTGASWFGLMALWFSLCIIDFIAELHHRSAVWFWIILVILLAILVNWPITIIRRLDRLQLNRLWLVPILSPAALLLLTFLEKAPHRFTSVVLIPAIAAPMLLIFLGRRDSRTLPDPEDFNGRSA